MSALEGESGASCTVIQCLDKDMEITDSFDDEPLWTTKTHSVSKQFIVSLFTIMCCLSERMVRLQPLFYTLPPDD